MLRDRFVLISCLTALALASCSEKRATPPAPEPSWDDVCIDQDADGYGLFCERGSDCDDENADLFENCEPCRKPEAGCVCAPGIEPVDCVVEREVLESGSLLCRTGKRYCRDGVFTECLGTTSFEVPSPSVVMAELGATLGGDAAPVICDACSPDCYRVDDVLETPPNDDSTVTNPGGGVTLPSETAPPSAPDVLDPTPPCTPGIVIPQFGQLDDDCDGIPDNYDNDPNGPPFASNHPAITMDLAPGESASQTFELEFFLSTVDVYFLIDTTGSMDGELRRLMTDLTTGTFLDDPSTGVDESANVVCASPPGTNESDATLKTKGIAGNIACLVPDSGFGAGFFREIPFVGADPNGIRHAFDWFVPFEHRQDIDVTVDKTLTALKKFPTAGNQSWPEADIFALQAVASGAQIYTGWDRPGVPARVCPNGADQFGWPCFRKEAIPVVLLITDAPMMNGPDVDVYDNGNLSSCTVDPWTFSDRLLLPSGSFCSTNSQCTSAYGAGFSCTSSRCVIASCSSDAQCSAFGAGYTCSATKCLRSNAVSATCRPDGRPDGVLSDDLFGTSGNKPYPVNYHPQSTRDMNVAPDGTYHPVAGNEAFASALDLGEVAGSFKTYTGDTRGMGADVHLKNLGGSCAANKWPTSGNAAAASATTPGYPDAVFKFKVTDPNRTLTFSTRGTHHAPTIAIVPVNTAGTDVPQTVVGLPASADTTPFAIGNSLPASFDYNINLNLASGYTGAMPRDLYGACLAGSGSSDLAPDALFAFTPSTDVPDATFLTRGARSVPEDTGAANQATGANLGTVDGQVVSYVGTTTTLTTNKWSGAQVSGGPSYSGNGCRTSAATASREHVLRFTVGNSAVGVQLGLTASFDSVLSVFGPTVTAPVAGVNVPGYLGCNYNAGSSADEIITLSSLAPGTYYVVVTGYTGAAVGNYTLTLTEATASHETIALFDRLPVAPTNINITGPAGVANTNDLPRDFDVGQVDGKYLRLMAGNSRATGIRGDYLPQGFQTTDASCSTVNGVSTDTVIDFSVGTTRKVRIETFDGTGSDSSVGASFDHALALMERPAGAPGRPTTVIDNDAPLSARGVPGSSLPREADPPIQFEGATYGSFVPTFQPPASIANTLTMTPSIAAMEMYDASNAATVTCNLASDSTQDSVYRLDVDAASAGTYDIDTIGSSTTTWLSVHDGTPDTLTTTTNAVTATSVATDDPLASDSASGEQPGQDLGMVDLTTLRTSGVTSLLTPSKWFNPQYQACKWGLDILPTGHEHVFNFTVGTTRPVRITMKPTGGLLYDGVVTLLKQAPWAFRSMTNMQACSRAAGGANANPAGLTSVDNGVITGVLTPGKYYVVVHSYGLLTLVGGYDLTVEDATLVTRVVATDDETADGGGPVPGVNLGDVSGAQVTYSGASTSLATDKWTQAQISNTTGTGCRAAGANDGKEHVLSFTVSGTRNRNLRIALSPGYDAVISVLSGASPPVAGSAVGSRLMACSGALSIIPSNETHVAGLTAASGVISGSFAPGTYYVVVHAYSFLLNTGSYGLTIQDTDYGLRSVTANSLDLAAGGNALGGVVANTVGDLGSLTGQRQITYTGTTSGLLTPDKWTQPQVSAATGTGCRVASAVAKSSNEHLFTFTAPAGTGPQNLEIQLVPSASTYDAVLSVFSLSAIPSTNTSIGGSLMACGRANAATSQVVTAGLSVTANGGTSTGTTITGNFTAGQTYYVMVHSSPTTGSAGTYTLRVTDIAKRAEYSARTPAVDDWSANTVSGPQAGVALGTADNALISYEGTTTTSDSHNKWTSAQLGASSAASGSTGNGGGYATACRVSTHSEGHEQVVRFTVASTRILELKLIRNWNWDASFALFDAPPSANSAHGASLKACVRAASTSMSYAVSGLTATAGNITGTFSPGTYYLVVQGYTAAAVGGYQMVVTDKSYGNLVIPIDAVLAGSSGPQTGVDLGTLEGRAITYTGTTSTDTSSKWKGTRLSGAPYTGTGCRSSTLATNTYEHVVQFTLAAPRHVAMRLTRTSPYDPVLTLVQGSTLVAGQNVSGFMACTQAASASNQQSAVAGLTATGGFISGDLSAGTYYAVIHAYNGSSNATGQYTFQIEDAAPQDFGTVNGRRVQVSGSTAGFVNQWTGGNLAGGAFTGNGGRASSSTRSNELVYKFNVSGSTSVPLVVQTTASSMDSVLTVFGPFAPGTTSYLSGGQNVAGFLQAHRNTGGLETISRSFAPGDYYVVVHANPASGTGTFSLEVRDPTWAAGILGCDSFGTRSSLRNVNLQAGHSYYVVVKGGVSPSSYGYKLNIGRSRTQPFLACNQDGIGARRSYIETELQGGKHYSIVVRGRAPGDGGTYGVILRDLAATPATLGCANSGGYTGASSDPSSFVTSLQAGKTYYMAVRSSDTAKVGTAHVRMQSAGALCEYNNVSLSGTTGPLTSEIVTKLRPGEYYAVLKGRSDLETSSIGIPNGATAGIPDDRGRGWYQFTVGDASLQTKNQQFTPPAWGTNTSGVYKELLDKGIRVITINSAPSSNAASGNNASDPYLKAQSLAISQATGTLDASGAALRRTIHPDGSGMGFAVVDAVAKFTQAIQMDISVRLVLEPDDPGLEPPHNRRFQFSVRAVSSGASMGCAPPIDADGDGRFETFPACGPGAKPRFEITVTNPAAPNNVPVRVDDPNTPEVEGPGYTMRLELVGKDRLAANAVPQVVDSIPLYVIPQKTFPDDDVEYAERGVYAQTIGATGCAGAHERPIWKSLYWNDTLPPGTAMEWRVCGGDDATELAACDVGGFRLAATVTPGDTCSVDAQCPWGYCNNGRCEYPVGNTCQASSECGRDGSCQAGRCVWRSHPGSQGIDLKRAIVPAYSAKRFMRVQAEFRSNAARNLAPTLHDFRIDYTCSAQE